jgi:hypothetical protein
VQVFQLENLPATVLLEPPAYRDVQVFEIENLPATVTGADADAGGVKLKALQRAGCEFSHPPAVTGADGVERWPGMPQV